MTFALAHLSDVHLGPIHGLGPRHVNVKRALGLANWLLKRRHIHLPEVVARLVADLHRQQPDHVAVTGDLVNLGLPGEMDHAARWLQALGPPSGVTLVPGNHDIYVRLRTDPGIERWRAYMSGDSGPDEASGGFPFLRRVGPLALIGLNSAVPRPPFYASGRLGADQLAVLGRLLDRAGAAGLVRVVLIHHPPLPGQADARRGLDDAAALQAMLAQHGAELVLHGHNHRDLIERRPARSGKIVAIGVASASAGRHYKSEPLARYNIYRFETDPAAVRIVMIGRGLVARDGDAVEIERREIARLTRVSPRPASP